MELNFLISVLDRDRADDMTAIYQDHNLPVIITFLGRGTARSEHLDLYGDGVSYALYADDGLTRAYTMENIRILKK